MMTNLKKYILIVIVLLLAIPSFGQRNVRKLEKQGNKAYKGQKYNQAISSYEKALKINPSSKVGNYNLSNGYYKQGQWDKSIELMNKYLKLENEDPKKMAAAWHNLGNALLHKKDLEQAIEAYKNSLRFNPDDNETRYNLAVAKKMKQNQDKDKDKNSGGGQQNQQNKDNKDNKDKDKNKDNKQQNQDNNQQNKDQKPQEKQPQQMSSENAKQILQAIQQDEKATQQRVQEMKAKEREEKAQDNRRNNKDW